MNKIICSYCNTEYEVYKKRLEKFCPLCKERNTSKKIKLSNNEEYDIKRFVASNNLSNTQTKFINKIRFCQSRDKSLLNLKDEKNRIFLDNIDKICGIN